MSRTALTPSVLELIAERFRALGEPARLQILNTLRGNDMTVTDLVEATGLGQANTSRHLRILHNLGFVKREKDGLFVYYAIADGSVFALCDVMCGKLDAEAKRRTRILSS